MGFLATANKYLDQLSELTGRIIAWLTLFMMLVTAVVVLMRYGFEAGSIALQESITYMHAIVFMLGAAYTLKHEGHVRVDVFYRNFNNKTKALVDLLGTLLFLFPLCLFILLGSLDYVSNSWAIKESSSEPGGIPAVFLLKTLIPAMTVLLMLQGLSIVCNKLLVLLGYGDGGEPGEPQHSQAAPLEQGLEQDHA